MNMANQGANITLSHHWNNGKSRKMWVKKRWIFVQCRGPLRPIWEFNFVTMVYPTQRISPTESNTFDGHYYYRVRILKETAVFLQQSWLVSATLGMPGDTCVTRNLEDRQCIRRTFCKVVCRSSDGEILPWPNRRTVLRKQQTPIIFLPRSVAI